MISERARELMIDALVAPLDAASAEELRGYVESSDECAAEIARYERIWRNLETIAVPERPDDGAAKLSRAVEREFGIAITSDPATVPEASQPRSPAIWKIAASLALIALGSLLTIGVQRFVSDEPSAGDDRNRYLLIMTETQETPEQLPRMQAEFSEWIDDLIASGTMETGFGIADRAPVGVPPDGPVMDLTVSGLIIIRAADEQEARRIAVSSPIIDYGGFIEIRELSNGDDE